MKREREIKLLRKKRLLKKYSDFELSNLASEIDDYVYLLKSIKFPIEDNIVEESKEINLSQKKSNDEKINKRNSLKGKNKTKEPKNKSSNEQLEENSEEYNGLKIHNEQMI